MNIKKILLLLCFIFAQSVFSSSILARENSSNIYTIFNNNKKINFDTDIIIVDGRIMVPVRNIAESLGCNISWDKSKKLVTIQSNNIIYIYVGTKFVSVYGQRDIELDVIPFINEGRVYVPLRFIAESLNKNVLFDASTNSIYIFDLVKNGWYIDLLSNYKIQMTKELRFEMRCIYGDSDERVIKEYSMIPLTFERISDPTIGVRTSQRYYPTIRGLQSSIEEIIYSRPSGISNDKKVEKDDFAIIKSTNESMLVTYEYCIGNNFQRIFCRYLKFDSTGILCSEYEAEKSYYLKNRENIYNSLMSIQNLSKEDYDYILKQVKSEVLN